MDRSGYHIVQQQYEWSFHIDIFMELVLLWLVVSMRGELRTDSEMEGVGM